MKQAAAQLLFDRYYRWRVEQMLAPDRVVRLDFFPKNTEPRYGHGKPPHPRLHAIIDRRRADYRARLAQLLRLAPLVDQIAANQDPAGPEPTFANDFFTGLDALGLIGMLAEFKPRLLLEIGSGHSTKFARKAIQHYGLNTRILSCDPEPRAEVEGLCDEVRRQPVETISPELFTALAPGDVLFIDGSHRIFQGSDTAMLFLEVIPELKSGVILQIHDIYLPSDYPQKWENRYYSEQYLLAAMLLANPDYLQPLLPNAFISDDEELAGLIAPIWRRPGMAAAERKSREICGKLGNSFWCRVG